MYGLARVHMRGRYSLFRRYRKLVLAFVASDALAEGDAGAMITEMFTELNLSEDFEQTEVGRAVWKRQDVHLDHARDAHLPRHDGARATLVLIAGFALIDNLPDVPTSPAKDHVVDQISHLLT